jgi:CheY-like chemotaxis protein
MDDFEIEYKKEALEEIQDNLDSFNELIRELESGQRSSDIFDEIFRIIHNIKGNSKSAGFDFFSTIVHELETKLLPLRDGSSELTENDIKILGTCHSCFYNAIEALKSELVSSIDFSNLSLELSEFGRKTSDNEYSFLIVDDEVEIVNMLTDYLQEEFSCRVTKAHNGEDAINLCRKNKYDCIITDYNMPVLTGLDLLNELRKDTNINFQTGIIFTSGYRPDLAPNDKLWENVFILNKPYKNETLSFLVKCGLESSAKIA